MSAENYKERHWLCQLGQRWLALVFPEPADTLCLGQLQGERGASVKSTLWAYMKASNEDAKHNARCTYLPPAFADTAHRKHKDNNRDGQVSRARSVPARSTIGPQSCEAYDWY